MALFRHTVEVRCRIAAGTEAIMPHSGSGRRIIPLAPHSPLSTLTVTTVVTVDVSDRDARAGRRASKGTDIRRCTK